MRSGITFLEAPATDRANLIQTHVRQLREHGNAGRFIYLYDVKSWNDRATQAPNPWQYLPSLDENHLESWLQATFALDQINFHPNDMLCLFDGRRPDCTSKIRKLIQAHKAHPSLPKKRMLQPPFRLLYTNKEFEPHNDGYAAGQRAKYRSLADPLETVYMVFGSEATAPDRGHQHLVNSGSGRLGLSDLKLRTAEQHGIRVAKAAYANLQKGMAVTTMVPVDDENDNEGGQDTASDEVHGLPWYPWTACVPQPRA